MVKLNMNFIRDLQRRFEAIPTFSALLYNALARRILAKPETKIAEDIAKKIKKGTVLDLGSGTGYLSIEIAKRVPNLQVYGIDLSVKMVEIAKSYARNIRNVKFFLGNAAKLPFGEESIDFIVSTGSLHHWRKPVKVFNECYRVLKEGKEAWIYDGCPDALKIAIKEKRKEYGLLSYVILTKITGVHGFTKEEYRNKIKDILEQTRFRKSYQMELLDIWMKIKLVKA